MESVVTSYSCQLDAQTNNIISDIEHVCFIILLERTDFRQRSLRKTVSLGMYSNSVQEQIFLHIAWYFLDYPPTDIFKTVFSFRGTQPSCPTLVKVYPRIHPDGDSRGSRAVSSQSVTRPVRWNVIVWDECVRIRCCCFVNTCSYGVPQKALKMYPYPPGV